MVGGLLLAPGRGELAVEQRGGGGEVGDPGQRDDQLAGVQRWRVDGVVGPRVGDEAVHVEVLGDPHRRRRGDPEPARGVGGEGGRVERGRRLARVAARRDLLHHSGARSRRQRCVGLGAIPELVGRVVGLERAVGVGELRQQLPIWLRHVGAALELALDDQRQGRALHAANGEEVGSEAAGRERHRAGQGRAPDQVDVLARGTGVGEVVREPVEVREGALDLVLGQGGIAGPSDRRALREDLASVPGGVGDECRLGDCRVHLEHLLERLEPDQLALAVVVGGDHDRFRTLGELADRLDHVLVGRLADELGVDQLVQVGLLPVRIALGEGDAHHVALEPDRHLLAAGVGPGVEGDLVGRVLRRLAAAEDVGDLARRVVLLRDDQPHRGARVAGGPNGPGRLSTGARSAPDTLPACPHRHMPARNASASCDSGSATNRASGGCWRRLSTSPACASRAVDAWSSAGARSGSRRSRACSPAAVR